MLMYSLFHKIHKRLTFGIALALVSVIAFGASPATGGTAGMSELRLSSREVLPLPPGSWKIAFKTDVNFCKPADRSRCRGTEGRALILQNLDDTTPVRTIVIHHTNTPVRNWNTKWCYERFSLYKDTHQTRENELTNKCSDGWDTGRYPNSNHWWWEPLQPGFAQLPPLTGFEVQFEIVLQEHNKRRFQVTLFIERGNVGATIPNQLLMAWKATYVEALSAGLFRGVSIPDPKAFALSAPTSYAELVAGDTAEKDLVKPGAQVDIDAARLRELTNLRNDLDIVEQMQGRGSTDYLAVAEKIAALEAKIQSGSTTVVAENQKPLGETSQDKTAQSPPPSVQVAQTEKALAQAKEQERLAQAEREQALEQAKEQERLAKLEREKAEAERRAKTEAERLAQEAAEREQVAKAEAERKRQAEAMRKVESVEAQLKRLQETLAQLKEQTTAAPVRAAAAQQAPRHALVIGNAGYTSVGALGNAVTDAQAFAKALSSFGFQVALHTDIKETQFKQAVLDFKSQVETGSEVVFYYAGHGVQFGTANYLLPVDVGAESSEGVKDDSVELQQILNAISEKQLKFTLAVVDACRDNPFAVAAASPNGRSLADNPKMKAILQSKGVTPTNTAAIGQMVIYSASAGQQALDSLGPNDRNPNGLFTRVFLEKMSQPGMPVDRVLRLVKKDVVRLAKSVNHNQVPALYDQTIGEFFFRP